VERHADEDENVSVTSTSPDDWSPADSPYATALSEAQWWQRAVQLSANRLRGGDNISIASFSSRQIDARQLIFALRQLLTAEQLEQEALKALRIDPVVGQELARARRRFEDALPGVKHMRDALMHFDEWSRGTGRGPQKERRDAGDELRDVARASFRDLAMTRALILSRWAPTASTSAPLTVPPRTCPGQSTWRRTRSTKRARPSDESRQSVPSLAAGFRASRQKAISGSPPALTCVSGCLSGQRRGRA
jgi:hypothetical protein